MSCDSATRSVAAASTTALAVSACAVDDAPVVKGIR
ncbi:Uncharacterised protein [Mycobacteroides abscessus subsp. abscessus]|nr:Uncharacterised protein [Mycobacteroides abscessus subsp. abscessus]